MLYIEIIDVEDFVAYLKNHNVTEVFYYSYTSPTSGKKRSKAESAPKADLSPQEREEERERWANERTNFYEVFTARVDGAIAVFKNLVAVGERGESREVKDRAEAKRKLVTDPMEQGGLKIMYGRWLAGRPEWFEDFNED